MDWGILIGLGIGIVATIAGGIGLKLAENRINFLGSFKIYAYFEREQADGVMIKFDIMNAKKIPYIMRDLNLVRFENNELKYFIQAEYSETKGKDGIVEKEKYCNDGSYSLVIPQQDTKQVLCVFMDKAEHFDFANKKYFIRFYDERGIAHTYDIDKKNKAKDSKWIELKKVEQKNKKRGA